MSMQGKTVIVTGGGRGIGAATSKMFALRGANVVINYLRNEDAARRIVDEICKSGGIAKAIQADIADPESCQRLVKETRNYFSGGIDVLVANATPLFGANPFETLSWEEFSGTVIGDLKSVFYPTKAVIPEMKKQKDGRIIYVSSLPAKKVSQGMFSHGVARSALTTFAKYIAKEYGPLGITANIVTPGMVETERTKELTAPKQFMASQTPLGRIATPEDVANAITFFAEEKSSFITGVEMEVDGGLHL